MSLGRPYGRPHGRLRNDVYADVRKDVRNDVYADVRTDVYTDVHTDVYTDLYTESRNALDGLKSKISPLRFRCTEREVWSSNVSRVMVGHGEIILINIPQICFK